MFIAVIFPNISVIVLTQYSEDDIVWTPGALF